MDMSLQATDMTEIKGQGDAIIRAAAHRLEKKKIYYLSEQGNEASTISSFSFFFILPSPFRRTFGQLVR